jgi:hypothetical protein
VTLGEGGSPPADKMLGISVLSAEGTALEFDGLTVDVIAKAEPTESEAVLPLFLRPSELFDWMAIGIIIWICFKNGANRRQMTRQFWVFLSEFSEKPVETRRGLHPKVGSYFAAPLVGSLSLPGLELSDEFFDWAALARAKLLCALGNVSPYLWILQFQIIFKFVCVHNPDDWNAVFLQDKVFLI